jgi:hypothetical protein
MREAPIRLATFTPEGIRNLSGNLQVKTIPQGGEGFNQG